MIFSSFLKIWVQKDPLGRIYKACISAKTLFRNILKQKNKHQTIVDSRFNSMTIKDFLSYIGSLCINCYWRLWVQHNLQRLEEMYKKFTVEISISADMTIVLLLFSVTLLTSAVSNPMFAEPIPTMQRDGKTNRSSRTR